MKTCLKHIAELERIRGIPQLFFCSRVGRLQLAELRKKIIEQKNDKLDRKEIDVVINSGGGDPHAAFKIISLLKNEFDKVNIIVPLWAKSAATLISLGADQIIMDQMGEFGPLDTQIAIEKDDSPELDYETSLIDESALELIEDRAHMQYVSMFEQIFENKKIKIDRNDISNQIFDYISKLYSPLLSQIDPYRMGQKSRITRISHQYAFKILSKTNMPYESSTELAYYLTKQYPEHGYVIDYDELKQFGVNVILSKEEGKEYEAELANFAIYLGTEFDHKIEYIGFIKKADKDSDSDKKTITKENKESDKPKKNGTPNSKKSKSKSNE